MVNRDARLKGAVRLILENCKLEDFLLDAEVQVNFTGDTDAEGNLQAEKEIDVVARFSYAGRTVLLLFECEDANSAAGVREHYRAYAGDVATFRKHPEKVQVTSSKDRVFQSRHFSSIDEIRVCFVYGSRLPDASFRVCEEEGRRHSFAVWDHAALAYFAKISSILHQWTKYELFRELGLRLELASTFPITAIKIKQKGREMYLGSIHPGLLLRIAYVVRRASERTNAYQRMLNKERIAQIGEFISSSEPQSFISNSVILVLDEEPAVQRKVQYDAASRQLTLPRAYCSAWMIDGQHRAYGFLGTKYERWSDERYEPFDLPVVIFRHLPEPLQTQTFININYFQKRIKTDLLCDLTTLTRDLRYKLTWPSLLGRELNSRVGSPLQDQVKINELHEGRPISLSSLVQFGLLETLLGLRRDGTYHGPLYQYAPFDRSQPADLPGNVAAFRKQSDLLIRFLRSVQANTAGAVPDADPWRNSRDYALLRPTGINALFMVLARVLQKYPGARVDLDRLLRPLTRVSFERDYVARRGGGWKGFRNLANIIIRELNRGVSREKKLAPYRGKQKL